MPNLLKNVLLRVGGGMGCNLLIELSRHSKEGMRPRSYDSSHSNPKKRFYHQDYSMGNKDRDPNRNSQGGGHCFETTRCPTCGKKNFGRCLAGIDGWFAGNKIHKMRYCPNMKARGKSSFP